MTAEQAKRDPWLLATAQSLEARDLRSNLDEFKICYIKQKLRAVVRTVRTCGTSIGRLLLLCLGERARKQQLQRHPRPSPHAACKHSKTTKRVAHLSYRGRKRKSRSSNVMFCVYKRACTNGSSRGSIADEFLVSQVCRRGFRFIVQTMSHTARKKNALESNRPCRARGTVAQRTRRCWR